MTKSPQTPKIPNSENTNFRCLCEPTDSLTIAASALNQGGVFMVMDAEDSNTRISVSLSPEQVKTLVKKLKKLKKVKWA